jgi:hypothetical protein
MSLNSRLGAVRGAEQRDFSKGAINSPNQMPTQSLTPQIITAAILGFEEQKRHIDSQIGELRAMLDGRGAGPAVTAEAPARTRRKVSAVARRRMALGQQKRWSAIKSGAESPSPVTLEPFKPKRKLSAAGRRAIIAATKKRWAVLKAAKVNQTKERPGAKKTARRIGAVQKAA